MTKSAYALVLLLLWTLVGTVGAVIAGSTRAVGAVDPAAVWPLAGAARVLTDFDPPEKRWLAGHRGVDLAAEPGQAVRASTAGTVTVARRIAGRGVVVVQQGSRRWTYEPVDAIVTEGQQVAAGEAIGRVGGGGSHCRPRSCLHWGLREGDTYRDPRGGVPDSASGIRLLPADAVATARRRAAERAEQARLLQGVVAGIAVVPGPPGGHGFLAPVAGRISSPFGMRFHPIRHVWKLHDGTDFAAGCGTPMVAAYAGVVSSRSRDPAYGNRLVIDHGRVDGRRVRTGYNHAQRYVVGPGQRVSRGQVVGYVGSTGLSTGCHLHFMVWLDGRLANPMSWL